MDSVASVASREAGSDTYEKKEAFDVQKEDAVTVFDVDLKLTDGDNQNVCKVPFGVTLSVVPNVGWGVYWALIFEWTLRLY